jgi:hypothetical protein
MPAKKRNISEITTDDKITLPTPSKILKKDMTMMDDGKSYHDKNHQSSMKRPPLPNNILKDLKNVKIFKKNMPLQDFLKSLNNPAYLKRFIAQRDKKRNENPNNNNTRRSIIFDIMSLEEIVYGRATKDCKSDLACIEHLLSTNLVNESNYIEVYTNLNGVLTNIMFDTIRDSAVANSRRSAFLDILKKHKWSSDQHRLHIRSLGVFRQEAESIASLKVKRSSERTYRMNNIQHVTEYEYLYTVQNMVDDVNKYRTGENKWFGAATNLISAACGSRWIESCFVTSFELSEIKKYDKNLYIVARGIAKENRKRLNMNQKIYNEAVERGLSTKDALEETETSVIKGIEYIDVLPDTIIVKPVLFHRYGITPEYIVKLSKEIETFVNKNVPRVNNENDETYRKRLSSRLYMYSNKYFKSIWNGKTLRMFNNVTHTWRKLYASMSFQSYGGAGFNINQQFWYQQVLGHSDLQTTFSYSTLVVKPTVKAQNEDHTLRMNDLERLVLQLTDKMNKQQIELKTLRKKVDTIQLPNEDEVDPDMSMVDVEQISLPVYKKDDTFVNVPIWKKVPNKKFAINLSKKFNTMTDDQKHTERVRAETEAVNRDKYRKAYKEKIETFFKKHNVDIAKIQTNEILKMNMIRDLGVYVINKYKNNM